MSNKTPSPRDPNVLWVEIAEQEDRAKALAELVCNSVLSARTLRAYAGPEVDVTALVAEMRQAGDEAARGDLSRVERMLASQLLTLDVLFNNLAQRSHRQDTFKGIEVLMRLALKAQSQARATAETLAMMKNPMPYIKQANIAHGHQQVNNAAPAAGASAHAGNFETAPNKLLEETSHDHRLDTRAPQAPSRADPAMEAVGAKHRAPDTRR